jgi:hypothetical protein
MLVAVVGLLAYRAIGTFDVPIPDTLKGETRGALVKVERVGKFPAVAVKRMVGLAELQNLPETSCGITMYRVPYRTLNHDNTSVIASGMLALPNGFDPVRVISYQHGTNPERFSTPSQPGLNEGLFGATIMAGAGDIFLAPDYIGLGEGREIHPYMHVQSTSNACLDFLKASHAFVEHLGISWPTQLYLMGFSQGAGASLIIQRDLETLDDPRFQVKANAPIAPPIYLHDISFPQALTGTTESHAVYLSYISNAYSHIYAQPIDSLLRRPYSERVPVLFDGDHTAAEIDAEMPEDPRELFTEGFLAAYDNGEKHWFLEALKENSIGRWSPRAPIHVYYGDEDVDVSPAESQRLMTEMGELGIEIQKTSVGPYDHSESAVFAIPKALSWFQEVSAN